MGRPCTSTEELASVLELSSGDRQPSCRASIHPLNCKLSYAEVLQELPPHWGCHCGRNPVRVSTWVTFPIHDVETQARQCPEFPYLPVGSRGPWGRQAPSEHRCPGTPRGQRNRGLSTRPISRGFLGGVLGPRPQEGRRRCLRPSSPRTPA